MKRFFIFISLLLVATSCATLTRERMTSVSFADYTAYPDMWLSPNSCTMAHQPLGMLDITIVPAINHSNTKRFDGVYSQNVGGYNFEEISFDELLGMAVAEARVRGANGISNLSIRKEETVYKVSGVLVKIE